MNIRWLNFPFRPNTNVETTLDHQQNVTLSTLFQRCFVNVETTSINMHWLNFHFQPNFNVKTMLVHYVHFQPNFNVKTMLDNDKCTLTQLSFSTKYQRWNNVDERLRSMLFQRWFNVDVFARNLKQVKLWKKMLQTKKITSWLARWQILNIYRSAIYIVLMSVPIWVVVKGQRTKTRERTKDESSHQPFHVNEPFFPDGVYKTNKVI